MLLLLLLLLLLPPPPNTATLPISPHHSTALHRSSSSANRHASTGANCSKTPQRLHVQHASKFPQQKNTGANATATPLTHLLPQRRHCIPRAHQPASERCKAVCKGHPVRGYRLSLLRFSGMLNTGLGVVFWWLFNTMKGSLWQHLYIDSMTFCIPLSFSSAQES
jgi:hypothetical protein